MADLRSVSAARYEHLDSFQAPTLHTTINNEPSPTAYHGAEGQLADNWNAPPAIHLDKDGFQTIQIREDAGLKERGATSRAARETLENRLSSIFQKQSGSPSAAALARSGTVLHQRARSWAAYVPKLNTTTNQSAQARGQPRPNIDRLPNKLFGDLFNGESAPVKIGVPTSPAKEKSEEAFIMEYQPKFTERPARDARRASTMSVSSVKASAKGSAKSSWFGRKASTPAQSSAPSKGNAVEDEILSININNSLFPHGPSDPLDPQAFNDLLLNATNLLQRMQASYKEKVEYIASVQPEIDAQREEVEEAETRSKHLKMQLQDIGRQAEEQKQVNEELIIQLSQEKMKLSEERERNKTIRLVRRDAEAGASDSDSEAHRRAGKRRSAGSDSGFESDADTASVISGGMQTPMSQRRPQLMLTPEFDRASVVSSDAWSGSTKQASLGEAAAWNTVKQLRNENRHLRVEMEELQRNMQECIDLVGGMCIGS